MQITTIGIDLAKNVFQAHGVNEYGKTALKKQIRRDQMATFFDNRSVTLRIREENRKLQNECIDFSRYKMNTTNST